MCKLRSAFDRLKATKELRKAERSSDAFIMPNVKIEITFQKVWNINCPLVIAKLNTNVHEIFNGQLVCFTSTKNFEDLIVATVLRNSQLELLIPKDSIIIEVISTENVGNIFNHSYIMVEPKTFFDPYAQVFESLKGLHEQNFPFKSRILKLNKEPAVPTYDVREYYTYQNYSFKLDSEWDKFDFGLQQMQLKALKSSVNNDFTMIVGPPGTGKSFLGMKTF